MQPSLATGPQCVALDTVVVDGRDAAARVAEREADVWIPDDLSWAAVARGGLLADDGEDGSGTVLATSPIYMVTDTATAARLTSAGGSWLALSKLVAGPNGVRLAVRDPNGSGDGMVAAGTLGEAVWIKDGMDASSAALSAALRQTRTVPGTARGPAGPAGRGRPGPGVCAAAGEAHRRGRGRAGRHRPHRRAPVRLAADRGRGGRPGPQGRPRPAAGRVEERGRGQGVRGGRAAPARRRGPRGAAVRLPQLTAPALPVLQPHHVDHVFAAWYVQDRRSSILLAVDVSGSMAEPAPGTTTPLIQLVRQGCLAVGQMLPDQSSLGLWSFGSQLDPPRDYKVLLPTAQLTDGQRAGLAGAVAQLAAEQTGTGLYDTILAAYKAATAGWRAGEANQVLVFTDGRNEDDPVSIGLRQLAAGLKQAADPKRPVELTVVAYGQLPEVAGLRSAVEGVDGYVSSVRTPAEVSAAFLHAAASGLHV